MRNKKYDIPFSSKTKEYANFYYHYVAKKKDIIKEPYIKQNIIAKDIYDYQQKYYIKNKEWRHPNLKTRCPNGYRNLMPPDGLRVHKGHYVITFD